MTAPDHLESEALARAGFENAFFTAARDFGDPSQRDVNRARAAEVVGARRVYWMSQVHGVKFHAFDGEEDPDAALRFEGDVSFAIKPGVGAGVRVADCVPVLVGDPSTGLAAAIHSGWRGTAMNVTGVALEAFRELGAKGELVAAIGPHIEACCFEVGEDVAAELARASSIGDAAIVLRPGAKPHVDLRAIVRAQLESAGVATTNIDDVRGCSVCDPRGFHSYRRDGAKSGRMLAVLARLAR